MHTMGPQLGGIPAMDLSGARDPNSPSKKEQFRILALNVAMGIENGRVETAKALAASGLMTDGVGDTKRVLQDAEAICKFIDSGH